MSIYIIMLLSSLFFAFFSVKVKEKLMKNIFMLFSLFPFLIVSAIRYDVGTDYINRYVVSYYLIANGYDIESLEFVFKKLITFCIMISESSNTLFMVTSLLIILPLFLLIFKESKNPTLSIALFFLGGFYFQSFNLLRQYISVVLLTIGFFNLIKGKNLRFIFLLISASLFHSSSWIGIILYPILSLAKQNISIKWGYLALLLGGIILFNDDIYNIFTKIISYTTFNTYIGSQFDRTSFSLFNFTIQIVIFSIMIYMSPKNDLLSNIFISIQALVLLLIAMSSIFSLFYRIVFFFSIYQIFSLPYFIGNVSSQRKRGTLIIIVILFYTMNIIYTNVINNYNEVIPYKTIFH